MLKPIKKNVIKINILITILALFLVACQKPARHTEINFAIAQAPLNLDPRYATDAASARVNRLIYQSLVDFDANAKPVSSLATWVQVNATQYRFSLKQKRTLFHHQKMLTAQDVKATYDSLIVLKDSAQATEFSNIKNIQVLDSETLLFNLNQPDKNFPAKLIIGILPQDLIAQKQDFSHRPVGNGALKFVSWQNKLTLSRVKDNQKINLIEVKDPTVRVLKLLRGEVDLLQGDLPPELVKYLQTKPEVGIRTVSGANFSYLGLNMRDPVFKNIKVRQAIAHAIDSNAIIQQVMVPSTRVAGAILPPEHYTNAFSQTMQPYAYNPALSKRLLSEAGIQLPLKLVYKTSTDAQRVRFATIMQAQMQPAGIQLDIKSLDWGTFFEDVKQGNFQLFGLTWVGIKTPDIYVKALGSQSFPPNGFNRGHYADAELDALLANENWPAATQRIYQQLPYIPLWYEGQFAAMRRDIQNYTPKPDGNWDDLITITRQELQTQQQKAQLQ
jgi:peptide/nickel transport system substrate-binding protein